MNLVYKSSIIDHYLVHTKIASNIIKANHKIIRFRDYNNFDATACLNDFNQSYTNLMLKWNTNENQANTTDKLTCKWNEWKNAFLQLSDKHAPFKSMRLKDRRNPWINKDIIKLINERDRAHKLADKAIDFASRRTLLSKY